MRISARTPRPRADHAIGLLEMVGLPDPAGRLEDYPHQFSGGQRQRIMIAMAIACRPSVLIADEPTTALDVTVQAQIVELVKQLRGQLGMAVIWITHDLALLAGVVDRVMVMYAGAAAEVAPVREIFRAPKHPYTRGLLRAMPHLEAPSPGRLVPIDGSPPGPPPDAIGLCLRSAVPSRGRGMHPRGAFADGGGSGTPRGLLALEGTDVSPLLEVQHLAKRFEGRRRFFGVPRPAIRAVDGVSFSIAEGETLGLVGESGCGKSTTGRLILRLLEASAGDVWFDGRNVTALTPEEMRRARRDMQMVFQDPYASLNPRMALGQTVREPLDVHCIGSRRERDARVASLLAMVGLDPAFTSRYPHQLSGGQRQRVGIARALATNPRFIVADEPLSSLDVSIQAQVVNLLVDLKRQLGLTYLFIAHDLAMVRYLSDRVAVMYLGRIVELASRDQLFTQPRHPYTRALLAAAPLPDPDRAEARPRATPQGEAPSPASAAVWVPLSSPLSLRDRGVPPRGPRTSGVRAGPRGRLSPCRHPRAAGVPHPVGVGTHARETARRRDRSGPLVGGGAPARVASLPALRPGGGVRPRPGAGRAAGPRVRRSPRWRPTGSGCWRGLTST